MTMLQLFGVILAAYLAGRTICWAIARISKAVIITWEKK